MFASGSLTISAQRRKQPVTLTPKRLWFLYCLLGLNKSEIEELTGWTRAQIDYRLRKWNLTMFSANYWETRHELLVRLATRFGSSLTAKTHESLDNVRRLLFDRIRERLLRAPIDWATIDAFE